MKTKKEAIYIIETLKEYYPDCRCSLILAVHLK